MELQSLNILLVEDDPVYAQKLVFDLEADGYTVQHISSSAQAASILTAGPVRFDIILMDVVLDSRPDGIELAAQLKQISPVPVIFLSNHTEEDLLQRMQSVSPYGFIQKNVSSAAIIINLKLAVKLHRATGKLHRQQQLFETVFEQGPLGLVIHDPQLNLTRVNRRFCQMTGYSEEELLSMNIMDITLPEFREEETELSRPVLNGTQQALTMEKKYLTKNGRTIDVRIHGTMIRDELGRPDYGFGLVEDISAQKQLQAGLKQTAHEKELLLRELQHRVKNNLTVISSILQMDSDRTVNPEAEQILNNARSRVNAMLEVYRDMNNSSSLLRIDLREYLQRFAGQILALHSSSTNPPRLRFDLDPVETGPRKAIPVGLIINELLTNAVKYAFPDQPDPEIRITLRQHQNKVRLEIADNGKGFSDTTLEEERNSSLGLQLVEMLCRQLGGEAEWETGAGTRFRTEWPL